MTANSAATFRNDAELKRALEDCLDAVDHNGSFAATGVSDLLNPGLQISGLGQIGLPLSQPEVKRIIECSRQAPFGKGSETIVDTSVRNCWEIDASCVKTMHPKWPAQQQTILKSLCDQMGIPGGSQHVEAQLYKLLVYEKDAMFKPHKDTEKAARMFGTLIKPVTSGYRVVLTYNLVNTGPSAVPDLADHAKHSMAMRSTLCRWLASLEMLDERDESEWVPDHLIYLLEHEYTEANLSFSHLKGNDRKRVAAVAGLLDETDMMCYLCTVEMKVYGAVASDGVGGRPARYLDEESDDDGIHQIEEVHDEDALAIDMDNIVQPEPFERRNPDEEEFGGWTGNEGADTTHWFRDTGLIVMPRSEAFRFLLDSGGAACEIRTIIVRELHKIEAHPTDEQQRHHVSSLCQLASRKWTDDQSMDLYARVFLSQGCRDLFIDLVLTAAKQLPKSMLVHLVKAIHEYGFDALRTSLDDMVTQYTTLGKRLRFLRKFSATIHTESVENTDRYDAWKDEQIDICLTGMDAVTADDAKCLVALACERGSGAWVSEKLLQVMKRFGKTLAFVLAISGAVLPALACGKLERDVAVAMFREAALPTICEYHLDHLRHSIGLVYLTNTDLLTLHHVLIELGMSAGEDALLRRLEAQCATAQSRTFTTIIMPYIWDVLPLIRARGPALPSDRHRQMFDIVFTNYIKYLIPNDIHTSQDLTTLHGTLLELRLMAVADLLMQRIRTQSASISADKLKTVLLPYLREVVTMAKAKDLNGEYEYYQWKQLVQQKKRAVLRIGSSDDLQLLLGDRYGQILRCFEVQDTIPAVSQATASGSDQAMTAAPREAGTRPESLQTPIGLQSMIKGIRPRATADVSATPALAAEKRKSGAVVGENERPTKRGSRT
ncbi:hypothetical protein LTR85_005433 [Meristemomyces frigidus]|nr:hypothetical protein LTR85_005433 [Meristemomyces frigidus]